MDVIGYFRSCRRCNSPYTICGSCNTGHAYCSDECRDLARQDQLKQANKTYAATPNGRRSQYQRNRRYREKLTNQDLQASDEKKVTDQSGTADFSRGSLTNEAPSDFFVPEQVSTERNVEDDAVIPVNGTGGVTLVRNEGNRLNTCCRCGISIEYLYVYSDELGPLRQQIVPVQRSPP